MSEAKDLAGQLNEELLKANEIVELEKDERVKLYRELESKLARLRQKLKNESLKRKQAEGELEQAQKREELRQATQDVESIRKIEKLKKKPGGNATAVLCLNDWHVEETVDPNTVNGLNEFNLEIADNRIKRTTQKGVYLLDFVRKICDVKELVVWLGGDLISGYIHEELEESNELTPVEAVWWVQQRIVESLSFLSKKAGVDRIIVPTSVGNHGRTTKRRRVSTRVKNNYEWIVYKNCEKYFENDPKVAFKITDGYHNYLEVQKRLLRFHHGDDMNYRGGVGGITIPVIKAIDRWNRNIPRPAQLDIFGHWHQYMDQQRFIACGCLIGANAYSRSIKAEFEEPSQTFAVIDKDYGKTLVMKIFCDEHTPEREEARLKALTLK